MTLDERKQECIKRGIVPGATVRCAVKGQGIVGPIDDWLQTNDGTLYIGNDDSGAMLVGFDGARYAAPDDEVTRLRDENAALRERLALLEGGPVGYDEEWVRARAMEVFPPDEVNDGCPWYGHRRSIEDGAARQMMRHLIKAGFIGTPSYAALRLAAQVAADALVETRLVRTALYNLCQRDDETRRLMDDVHRLDATVHTALSGLRALGITPTDKP